MAPYSVRAKPTAPVATPLEWEELDTTEPWHHTMTTAVERLQRHGDSWANFTRRARSLRHPRQRLDRLTGR